ncbi:liprin-beta-1-like isoform X2 [Palaemon carinicauda]|uniref:liprin-beta-1-like isoform X2 n=1 Tax=Palaemon carinicauda TaxID=392227 RepID=UPI0035B5D952
MYSQVHTNGEASKMLEAALQQMDGIIAGAQLELASLPDRSMSPVQTIAELAEKLRTAIQNSQDDDSSEEIEDETKLFLLDWLKASPRNGCGPTILKIPHKQ